MSWFKAKPKNRRLEREHVLDVKLRSSQVRAVRLRLGAIGLATIFGMLFGGYLLWRAGHWALNCLVYENKAFAVEDIDIQSDGVVASEQLRRWAGVGFGQNLLALDLGRVKRDLELVPLVRSASLERILPHKLRVRILEREPLAQIHVSHLRANGGVEMTVFQLDAEGFVMPPLDPRHRASPASQPQEELPLISGINANQLQPGRRIEARPVLATLELLQLFEQSPMAGLVELKRIDVSAPDVLLVSTAQGSEVTLGLTDLEQQLRRWHRVFELGLGTGKAIATLDLAVASNIPARWLEASALPPLPAKAPKSLRTRKKHV